MANMLIQLKVKDFEAWKKVFDTGNDLRKSSGELSHQIYRDAGDPNMLTAIYKWDSLENAQKFAQSAELKALMEKAGVLGPPSVTYLNEV
jgi:quinol monooxygenase YgiN